MIAIAAFLLAAPAWGADPCGKHVVSETHADVVAAVEALAGAQQVDPAPVEDDGPNLLAVAETIHTLQRGGTDDREERRIVALLEELDPLPRAQVLRLIDQGRDKYDLRHMVYEDVDELGRRARLLQLLDEAGQALTDAGAHEIGVISDIDDTVAPLKGGARFPGAGALYQALERGQDGRGQDGDIHYVTARPALVMGDVRGRLDRAGVPQGTVDDGNLGEAIFRGQDGYEDEKVRDIERQLRLHPGQRFVLIGDDTQRDPEVYRRIVEAHPDRIAGVFIHQVEGGKPDTSRFPPVRFFFFDDYAQVAEVMAQRGLITKQAPANTSGPGRENRP